MERREEETDNPAPSTSQGEKEQPQVAEDAKEVEKRRWEKMEREMQALTAAYREIAPKYETVEKEYEKLQLEWACRTASGYLPEGKKSEEHEKDEEMDEQHRKAGPSRRRLQWMDGGSGGYMDNSKAAQRRTNRRNSSDEEYWSEKIREKREWKLRDAIKRLQKQVDFQEFELKHRGKRNECTLAARVVRVESAHARTRSRLQREWKRRHETGEKNTQLREKLRRANAKIATMESERRRLDSVIDDITVSMNERRAGANIEGPVAREGDPSAAECDRLRAEVAQLREINYRLVRESEQLQRNELTSREVRIDWATSWTNRLRAAREGRPEERDEEPIDP